nr:MAG TPA: hypothetical protein [Caudoviricetes sp.]
MRNDITDWLSAAALIALRSSDIGTYPQWAGRPSRLRTAASALYLDRRALRSGGDMRNRAVISHGEYFEVLDSLAVWFRSPAGEIAGWHNL